MILFSSTSQKKGMAHVKKKKNSLYSIRNANLVLTTFPVGESMAIIVFPEGRFSPTCF